MTTRRTLPAPSAKGAALALGLSTMLPGCGGDAGTGLGDRSPDIYLVERGPMRISVSEAAELKAAKETRISSDIEGQATIIYLIPEGEVVQEGQRLVELDVSDLQERRANQAITVSRASATLVNARQNMEIIEKEIRADTAEAETRVQIARIDLEKFIGRPRTQADLHDVGSGDEIVDALTAAPSPVPSGADNMARMAPDDGGPAVAQGGENGDPVRLNDPKGTNADMVETLRTKLESTQYEELVAKVLDLLEEENLDRDMGELAQQVMQQGDEISLARQSLSIAKETFDHSRKLAQKDYITRNELDKDRLEWERQESKVALAWQQLDLLISYLLRKEKLDLQLKFDNAELGLERVKASASARRTSEEAELSSRDQEFELARERLENLDYQISHAVLKAPNPGLVVYAELDRRGREVIEEGMTVRERQTLLLLPNVTKMVAEIKVQEADIDKVVVGQRATIEVDAFPDRVLTGRVSRVSPLADSGERWSNNTLKVYKTQVALDGENEGGALRPNMSAYVEILVGQIDDTIAVPLPAVRRQGAVQYVWKATPQGPLAQAVKIGRNNLTQVEILDGVSAGERVYLAPPSGAMAPQFAQPERAPAAVTALPPEPEPEPEPRGRGGSGGGRQGGAGMAAFGEYQQAVLDRLPQFKDLIEQDGFMRASRDPDLRAAIDADPELKEMRDKMMQGMRGRGRRGEGSGEGDGNGDRGFGRGGEGGGREGGQGGGRARGTGGGRERGGGADRER